MAVQGMNLSQVQAALISGEYPSQWATNLAMLSQKGLSVTEFASEVERVTDGYVKATISKSGNILGYTVSGTPQQSIAPVGTSSNTATIARGTISAPVSTTVEAGSTAVRTSRLAGVGTKVATAAGKLAIPLTLAGIGITLGKTIDETLYNANPQYWDSIGLSTLNPQTWSSLVGGDDTIQGQFFNAIFGIDPNTGETQPYIDANAMAYCAYAMQSAGMFGQIEAPDQTEVEGMGISTPLYTTGNFNPTGGPQWGLYEVGGSDFGFLGYSQRYSTNLGLIAGTRDFTAGRTVKCTVWPANESVNKFGFLCASSSRNPSNSFYFSSTLYSRDSKFSLSSRSGSYTYNGQTVYYACNEVESDYITPTIINGVNGSGSEPNDTLGKIAWLLIFGTQIFIPTTQGIGNQQGATLPDFSNLSESDYLPYLQQTYPQMFNDAITYPVVQPDGTVTNKTYVPITLPNTSNVTNTQPVSGGQTQANPSVNPDTAPQTLIDLLTKLLQQPANEPITDDITPPENPIDTGEGSSPTPIVPVGSASSLWKIYHPTQAQVNSFGSWLWSSDFIDQILKIFNNPMEAVIGLHKVYATPIDAGNATIKVGYLDSQVPSAYIEQQYITVDCGSVDLLEHFGNVFDYSPFTDVQLYLPFVGIVPLNVSDVMRSSVHVKYGVDVITGACLAQVEISRDGNSAIIYQYSGNCAVQYPISSGSYMGIVTSIISVAGGVAATVASGGAAAPLALGAAGGLLGAHTTVQHSGSFSGNAGAMGGKIPYLIISRPQTKVAAHAESLQGYPTNAYVTIGDCTGYVKAESTHIINVNATNEELTEINNLILSGIII